MDQAEIAKTLINEWALGLRTKTENEYRTLGWSREIANKSEEAMGGAREKLIRMGYKIIVHQDVETDGTFFEWVSPTNEIVAKFDLLGYLPSGDITVI